jgi:DNA-binding beta-propeller fold protein YncE
VTVSGGGTDVYAAASEGSAVSVFRRDPVTGTLAQLGGGNGCTSEGGTDGCATGHGLTGAFGVTLSHDGTNAYVASLSAISSFLRVAPSGRLVEFPGRAGCISERGTDGCAPGRGLRGASTIVLSDDGRNAYAASFNSGAISAFQRVRAGGKRR